MKKLNLFLVLSCFVFIFCPFLKISKASNSPISIKSNNYYSAGASEYSFFQADAKCRTENKRLPTVEELLFALSSRVGSYTSSFPLNSTDGGLRCYWTQTQPDYYHMVGKVHLTDYTNNRLLFLLVCIDPAGDFTIIPANTLSVNPSFPNYGQLILKDTDYTAASRTFCVQAK